MFSVSLFVRKIKIITKLTTSVIVVDLTFVLSVTLNAMMVIARNTNNGKLIIIWEKIVYRKLWTNLICKDAQIARLLF